MSKRMKIKGRLRRLQGEMAQSTSGQEWTFIDSQFLYVPVKLCRQLQKRAQSVGRDPALIFTFKTGYPFRPPMIYYYSTPVRNIYHSEELFAEDMTLISGTECLCCHSILCDNNWTWKYTIDDVIGEFKRITTLKVRVVERLFCKKVQEQLIPQLLIAHVAIFHYL